MEPSIEIEVDWSGLGKTEKVTFAKRYESSVGVDENVLELSVMMVT